VTVLGATMFFTWLAFWGQYLCYRAFRIALPDGDRVRYGRLIFLFPSVLFWTAPIGKDAIIFFGLGLALWGVARVFTRARGGFIALAASLSLIMAVRPNIALTIFIALIPAYVVGRRPGEPGRRIASKVVGVVALLVIGSLLVPRAEHFLGVKDLSFNSVNNRLKRVSVDTTNVGSQNFGTAAASTNTPTVIDDPARIPIDIVTVLFRPFPWEAPTTVTLLASLESLFLLALTGASWRRLLAAIRHLGRRPYVGYSLFYVILFIGTFASVGNFGILARERVQTLPPFFVLLAATPPRRSRPAVPPDRPALRTGSPRSVR
jgi:4-amino-4-deoxy-L-arabinose transferase-like glycosyltransferase